MLVVVPLDVSMNAANRIGHSACGACANDQRPQDLTREFSQPESHCRNLLDELMSIKLRHDMAVSIT